MAVGPQTTRLVPSGSRVLAATMVALALVIEVSLIAYGHVDVLLRATPAVLLVAVGAVLLFWIPRVELDPATLTIVNPLRRWRISWPAIRDIDDRWSLAVDTSRGRVTAWGAPAPGVFSQRNRRRRDRWGRPGFSPEPGRDGSSAGLVRRQWESYRDQGLLAEVEGAGVESSWSIGTLVIAVLVALALVGALLP